MENEEFVTSSLERMKTENEGFVTSSLERTKTENEEFVTSSLERMKQTLIELTIQQGGGQPSVPANYTPPDFTVQEWLSQINLPHLWPTFSGKWV
eukprot:TRINITY_DN414_c0_g1_i1.p1 TRINITY_DN414_c0_g1~~TRINITY_DN414_c0_g1_i1.p1  ORF type:complete len:111 (-),score=25.02 TRINITY_DN414_c0_g1_i1:191-475(-)